MEEGDEIFPNGIFVFNIAKMLDAINENPGQYPLETIVVRESFIAFSRINEAHANTVDLAKPVILAEIAPGQYNLIDGHHRMAKAIRLGLVSLPGHKLCVNQHLPFLTTVSGYEAYVRYWNDKLKQAEKLKRSMRLG
jgi:hypothetical protein